LIAWYTETLRDWTQWLAAKNEEDLKDIVLLAKKECSQ